MSWGTHAWCKFHRLSYLLRNRYIKYPVSQYLLHCSFFRGEIRCGPLPVAWMLVLAFKDRVSGRSICECSRILFALESGRGWEVHRPNQAKLLKLWLTIMSVSFAGARWITTVKKYHRLFTCHQKKERFFTRAFETQQIFLFLAFRLIFRQSAKQRSTKDCNAAEESNGLPFTVMQCSSYVIKGV